MGGLRALTSLLIGLLVLGLIVGALMLGLTLLLAFVGPIVGASYAAMQWRMARTLWASNGRMPIQGGWRIVPVGRLRAIGTCHLFSGLGGLAAGVAPTVLVLGRSAWWVPLLVGGLLVSTVAGAASMRILRGARVVEVLEE